MKKKIISLLLAITMIASVATVVNAATQVQEGTAVTLPEKTLVVDGGFETAKYLNPEDKTNMKSYIPTFTATEDKGYSTERIAKNAQIISDAGVAIEGKQCILLAQGENITISLPNLYEYKGGKLVVTYYVKAKAATADYGTWGKLEDRSVKIQDEKDPTKSNYAVVSDFKDAINFWTQPAGTSFDKVWTKLSEEIVIPDTITTNSEYVLNFGAFGNVLYYDAISCVVKKADGTEVDPVAFATPTPAPTVEPTPEAPVTVKFTKKSIKIKKGKKATLKVKITGATKATFSVNKKKVVKITKKKAKKVTVKALKKGKAVVTAKVGTKKAKCKVTVK